MHANSPACVSESWHRYGQTVNGSRKDINYFYDRIQGNFDHVKVNLLRAQQSLVPTTMIMEIFNMGVRGSWPALAIKEARPTVFRLMVFPPVFGPVITSTMVFAETTKSTGTGGSFSSCATWLGSYSKHETKLQIYKIRYIDVPHTPT